MDYVKYLKSLKMIGQFYPWKKEDGVAAVALLVAVDIALAECNHWANQDLTRSELLTLLKAEDVLVFGNIEEYVKWKETGVLKTKSKYKRNISEERRNALKKHAEMMRDKIRPTN